MSYARGMARAAGPVLLLVMACSSAPAPPVAPTPIHVEETAMIDAPGPKPVSPPVTPGWSRGPAVQPVAELEGWLRGAGRTELRVPVELTLSALGIEGAVIGLGGERLGLDLDDSGLGISLADRARDACGTAATCAMWLRGRWLGGTLIVSRADGAIGADERDAAGFVYRAE